MSSSSSSSSRPSTPEPSESEQRFDQLCDASHNYPVGFASARGKRVCQDIADTWEREATHVFHPRLREPPLKIWETCDCDTPCNCQSIDAEVKTLDELVSRLKTTPKIRYMYVNYQYYRGILTDEALSNRNTLKSDCYVLSIRSNIYALTNRFLLHFSHVYTHSDVLYLHTSGATYLNSTMTTLFSQKKSTSYLYRGLTGLDEKFAIHLFCDQSRAQPLSQSRTSLGAFGNLQCTTPLMSSVAKHYGSHAREMPSMKNSSKRF